MRVLKGLVRLVLLAGAVFAAFALFASGSSSYSDPTSYYLGAGVAVIVAIWLLPEALRDLIGKLIQWGILLGAAGLTLAALSSSSSSSDNEFFAIAGGVVVLFMLYRLVVYPARLRGNVKTVPATIVRISTKVRVGDAAMMRPDLPHGPVVAATETYVLFDSRGERIQLKLSSRQAREFARKYSEGDTGRLTYSLNRLIDWELPTPERPVADVRQVSVFISYSHQWTEDAEYLAQFFRAQGLSVWFDKNQLRVGDRLTGEITNAIRKTNYFMPVLAPEYWASDWCVKEFELAAASKIRMLPIKVSAGSLVMPPHIRQLYRDTLGEPIFLDLRGRNPIEQLKQLSAQMTGARLN